MVTFFASEGITPAWEDPLNDGGGKWILLFPIKEVSEMNQRWLDTLLACIGEGLEDDEISILCGAVLSVRKTNYRIAIWTKKAKDELIKNLGIKLKKSIKSIDSSHSFKYYTHDQATKQKPAVKFSLN